MQCELHKHIQNYFPFSTLQKSRIFGYLQQQQQKCSTLSSSTVRLILAQLDNK